MNKFNTMSAPVAVPAFAPVVAKGCACVSETVQ